MMIDAIHVETGLVEVSGAPLSYDVAGSGPPLVLLHEGIADRRMYDDQFDAFARRHRVVRYDLHGFGQSGTPDRPYAHHEALRALLSHLGITRAALLGMSMGGSIAIDFTLAYPSMVDALLLMATSIGGYTTSEAANNTFGAPIDAAFEAGDTTRAVELLLRVWVDGTKRDPDDVAPGVRARVREMMAQAVTRPRGAAQPLDPPTLGRLAEVSAPTLIIVGDGDIPDVLYQADLLEDGIAGAQKVVLPRVAHVLNMECPTEVNRLVLDFLSARRPV